MTAWTNYSVRNPSLVGELRDDAREEFYFAGRGAELDLDHYDKLDEARTRQYKRSERQTVLGLFDELEQRGEGYLERARARDALARYLRDVVAPVYPWAGYAALAGALIEARQHGLWGIGEKVGDDGNTLTPGLALEWTGRVGQVKLCPDDAREESCRVAALYEPRLAELLGDGCELRYCVFTFPNSPLGFLRADIYGIIEHFKRAILFRCDDGRIAKKITDSGRTFAYIKGALATVEAPLSAHGDWNVHLNVVLVSSTRPDYKALRDAWGEGIQAEFRTVPEGAERAALRELVKYPLKAISLKSEQKAAAGSRAPPVIEWPAEAFHEWWTAHKGFRRTRSWGVLYAGSLEEPRDRRVERYSIEWLGKVFLSPARFHAQRPMIDTRELDERQAQLFEGRPSPQRELLSDATAQREALHELLHSLYVDPAATPAAGVVDLILGNKSAPGTANRPTGPPETGPPAVREHVGGVFEGSDGLE